MAQEALQLTFVTYEAMLLILLKVLTLYISSISKVDVCDGEMTHLDGVAVLYHHRAAGITSTRVLLTPTKAYLKGKINRRSGYILLVI